MEAIIKLISSEKQLKLIKSFPKYMKSKGQVLQEKYGYKMAQKISVEARRSYPAIVQVLPTFNSAMYDSLMVVASKLAALKKGMKAAGISTEEFVKFNIEQTRLSSQKIPKSLRKLGGKIYLSPVIRKFLGRVAIRVSENGWPTKLINGTKNNDIIMSLETRNCQMVAFWESIGEGDIRPYCTFFDFSSAEALGIGLRQVSTIDSGVCKYCFYKKGKVEWPEKINELLN